MAERLPLRIFETNYPGSVPGRAAHAQQQQQLPAFGDLVTSGDDRSLFYAHGHDRLPQCETYAASSTPS